MQDRDATAQPLVARNRQTGEIDGTAEYHHLTEELNEIRERVGPIASIVIDNVGTAYQVNGNDYQETNAAVKCIQRWSTEFGSLVLNIGHTNKGSGNESKRAKPTGSSMTADEVLNSVMGSTGWNSAHRGVLVMFQMTEDEELALANSLLDPDFDPEVDRRRYIHAQVVKENARGIYMGRLTLRRDGVGLVDVSAETRRGAAEADDELIDLLTGMIADLAKKGEVLMKTGKNGLFQNRDLLHSPFRDMTRDRLEDIATKAISLGSISNGGPDGQKGLFAVKK
jgi:hypothetical protein